MSMTNPCGETRSPKALDIGPPPFVVGTKPGESMKIVAQRFEYKFKTRVCHKRIRRGLQASVAERYSLVVIPAKAGIHLSTGAMAETGIPAFVGMTIPGSDGPTG
jgi:hypothetical protein